MAGLPVVSISSLPGLWQALWTPLRRLKSRLVGDDLWTGPGQGPVQKPGQEKADRGDETVEDVSFLYAGGPEAVLLIHGLTGTPTEMRLVGKGIAAAGYTVYGMQLAGHCGSEALLTGTTWQDWYASVEQAWDRLAEKHRTIYVAGLSMGAVLALHLAARRPVRAVALYSVTLWHDGWAIPRLHSLLPLVLMTPLGMRYRFVETFPYGIKDERLRQRVVAGMMSGNSATAGTLGMTGASLQQMRRLSAEVRRELPRIHTPVLALHSDNDDVASVKNARYIQRHMAGPVEIFLLDDCYHIITVDRQRHKVVEESVRFFRQFRQPEEDGGRPS